MTQDYFERWRGHRPGLMGASTAYAVLVPLVFREGEEEPSLLFEVRSGTLRRQPGEVCFPGGKMEAGETPEQCALREAQEELNLCPDEVEIIGPMDYICGQANFLLHPILARMNATALEGLTPNADEVAETFLVPVSFFRNPPMVYTYNLHPQVAEDFPYDLIGFPQGYPWRTSQVDVPIYRYGAHTIWGLTGRIVRHLFSQL